MCRAVRVHLSAEDKADAKRLTGLMIPGYAVVVLALVLLAAAVSGPRSGELVASASAPATTPLK